MQPSHSEPPRSLLKDDGKSSGEVNTTLVGMGLSAEILELATKEPMASPLDRKIKRLLDVVCAASLLVLCSPLLLLASVMVATTSRGPVLFSQERWGKDDSRFRFFKFRTMSNDRDGTSSPAERSDGSLVKLRHDPRVTWVGRILRKTSLDELPQLWNVLLGDMSMVGPRPLVIPMLVANTEFRKIRGIVEPGITGFWQVRDRRNNDHVVHMASHDIEYVITRTNWVDIKILLSTVPAVLSCRGAF